MVSDSGTPPQDNLPASPAGRLHQNYRFRKPLRPGHHQLVKQLDQLIIAGNLRPSEICAAAGVDRQWISRFRTNGTVPNIANFDAILQVLGYRLAIVRKLVI